MPVHFYKTITVVKHQGATGKTTTAVNLVVYAGIEIAILTV